MGDAASQFETSEDFLAWEARQPERWERLNGVVRRVVGASPNHNVIARCLAVALQRRAPGCGVYTETVQLRVGTDLLYPDVMLACPRPPRGQNFISTPLLVAEIDSPSNNAAYSWRKLALYQSLPSLQAVLLLAQDTIEATLYFRRGGDWIVTQHVGADAALDLPGCAEPLLLGELYAQMDFTEEPQP